MGQGFLIDTNAIIDYLDEKLPENGLNFIDGLHIQLSVISRIELLAWRNVPEEQLQVVKDFVNVSRILGLDEDIVLQSIEIRRNYRLSYLTL